MNQLLTENELAERLKVSRNFLWTLRKRGLPFITIGRNVRYESAEVDAWLASNRHVQEPSNQSEKENEQ